MISVISVVIFQFKFQLFWTSIILLKTDKMTSSHTAQIFSTHHTLHDTTLMLHTITTWGNMNPGNCVFSHAVYRVSWTTVLWLAISMTLIISVSAVQFHPRLDKEQLSTSQFPDSNGHHQWRGECRPTTQHTFSIDVAQLRIARCIDAIVLQVDWRRHSEHFFVREACSGNFWSSSHSVVFETRYTAWLHD